MLGGVQLRERNLGERNTLRRIELPQAEALSIEPMQGLVQVCFRDQPALERFGQRLVCYPATQVVTRPDRQRGSFRRVLGIVVSPPDARHGVSVPDHRASEAPLVAKNFCQQPVIRRSGHPVDRVVRAHHARGVTLPNARLKRGQVSLVQVALGHHCIEIGPLRFGTAMRVEVLHRGDGLQVMRIIALEPRDEGNPEAAGQEGIFAVGFLAPAPTRIPENIDVRRPNGQVVELTCLCPFSRRLRVVLIVLGPDLRGDHLRNGVIQIRIPRRGLGDRLGENRGRPAPCYSVRRITRPEEVQYTQPRYGGTCSHQLADFLGHGHSPDQVVNALVDRKISIEVRPGRVRGAGTVCRLGHGSGHLRKKKNGEKKGAVKHGKATMGPLSKAHRRGRVAGFLHGRACAGGL